MPRRRRWRMTWSAGCAASRLRRGQSTGWPASGAGSVAIPGPPLCWGCPLSPRRGATTGAVVIWQQKEAKDEALAAEAKALERAEARTQFARNAANDLYLEV